MRKFHTTQVQGVEILAVAAEDNGYGSIKVTQAQAQALGHKSGPRGKELFGRTARHQVVENGRLAEFVTVAVIGRTSIIL